MKAAQDHGAPGGLNRSLLKPPLRIGSLSLGLGVVMAPLAGITNLPFRMLARQYGADLVTSEMVSAHGLVRRQIKTLNYLKTSSEETPLAVQIFGADPEVMSEAARIVEDAGAAVVDINAGCPVKKVVKTGAGGALLKDPGKLKEILTRVRRSCGLPLTLKMRTGWSPQDTQVLHLARIAEDCGVDAITLHARSVKQGFSGAADWSFVAELKANLRIPIIGNGDLTEAGQSLERMQKTGCDGIMIGRGAIGNPWIFGQVQTLAAGLAPDFPNLHDRRELIMRHFDLLRTFEGEARAARLMRGLLFWYTKSLPFSSRFRGQAQSITGVSSLTDVLDRFFDHLAGEMH